MSETRKTEKIDVPKFVAQCELANALRRILHDVKKQAVGDMTLPGDEHDRLIALNMMDNVFDRLDDAIEVFIVKAADQVKPPS